MASIMKKVFWTTVLLVLSFSWARVGAEETVIQQKPVRLITSSERNIFPESWLSAEIDAKAEALRKDEIKRSRKILNSAIKKYRGRVLADNLDTVYVLHRLKYYGISVSGTNSWPNVYIANRGSREGFTDQWVETTFHEEFSSILLRNFPGYLAREAWEKANGESFRYGESGVQAVKDGTAGQRFDAPYHAEGFLYEYAKSTLENDLNSIAGQLFIGDPLFWQVVDKYPRMAEKTELVISFYNKIHPGFDKRSFRSLAGK